MELNQIILKRLLESKLSEAKRVEEHKGWTYWEMPNGYEGPWEAGHYYKEYPGDLYVAIYPPQDVPYEGQVDSWAVSISDGSPDIDEYDDEFDSFEQAEEYVNNWIESHDITESSDSEVSKDGYDERQRELDARYDTWQSGHRDGIEDFSGEEYDELPFEESVAPYRGYKSTREENVRYAKELLFKARDTGDAELAWELVDFIWDTELLSNLSDIEESVDSASVDDIIKYDKMKTKSVGDKDKHTGRKPSDTSDKQNPGDKDYLPADPQDEERAKRRELIKSLLSKNK